MKWVLNLSIPSSINSGSNLEKKILSILSFNPIYLYAYKKEYNQNLQHIIKDTLRWQQVSYTNSNLLNFIAKHNLFLGTSPRSSSWNNCCAINAFRSKIKMSSDRIQYLGIHIPPYYYIFQLIHNKLFNLIKLTVRKKRAHC